MISIIWANGANIRILQDSCISRHENGPLLAIYDGKAKTTGQMPTFKDRIDKIIECLWVGLSLGKPIYCPINHFLRPRKPSASIY